MGGVNQQFLLSTLVIALGWLLRRGILDERDAHGLVRLVFNVTLPALVIHTFSGVRIEGSLGLMMGIALGFGLSTVALAVWLFRRRPRRERGQLSMLVGAFNIGLFAYPLVEATMGLGALRYLAMFDTGNAFVNYVVCYAVASHHAGTDARIDWGHILRSMARNVPLITYLLTVALGALGLGYPGPVLDVAALLARANMPLALLILGIYLKFTPGPGKWRDLAQVLGLRYALGLLVGVGLFLLLPLDPLFRTIALVSLLLPPPLITLSYAVQLGYDDELVGLVLNVANVVSYLALWAIFNVLR